MTTRVELTLEDCTARVRFSAEGGVHLFSSGTRKQLGQALDELEKAAGCRVAVFEATGRTFIAGADINELKSLDFTTGAALAREGQELMNRIARLPAVTLAAIHAACAGGGCELALACDMRMAAESAVIGLPEATLGLIPGWGGTVRATRLFGAPAAARLILTGELLPAAEAARLGIVDTAIPDERFRQEVDKRIERILSAGPEAVRSAKQLIAACSQPMPTSGGSDTDARLALEALTFAERCAAIESTEGMQAFLEKRPPGWTSAASSSSASSTSG